MRSKIETAVGMSVGIGTVGLYDVAGQGKFMVRVKVVDMRLRDGMIDACVEPLSGQGRVWINARRVVVNAVDRVVAVAQIR